MMKRIHSPARHALLSACVAALSFGAFAATPAASAPTPQDATLAAALRVKIKEDLKARGVALNPQMDAEVEKEIAYRERLARLAIERGLDKTPAGDVALRLARQEALVGALINAERAAIKISEKQLKEDYESAYPMRKQVDLIMAIYDTLPKAEDALKQAKAGKSLSELAKQSTDQSLATVGGKMGFMPLDALPAEVAPKIAALKSGEFLAEPVKTPFGFMVAQSLDQKVARDKTFEQTQAQLRSRREEMLLGARMRDLSTGAIPK